MHLYFQETTNVTTVSVEGYVPYIILLYMGIGHRSSLVHSVFSLVNAATLVRRKLGSI